MNVLPLQTMFLAASIALNPNPTRRGGEVALTATGLTPGSTVYAFFTPPFPIDTNLNGYALVADSAGTARWTFPTLIATEPGQYPVLLSNQTGQTIATTMLTITNGEGGGGIPMEWLILGGIAVLGIGAVVLLGKKR